MSAGKLQAMFQSTMTSAERVFGGRKRLLLYLVRQAAEGEHGDVVAADVGGELCDGVVDGFDGEVSGDVGGGD